jgi:hypothetical protein
MDAPTPRTNGSAVPLGCPPRAKSRRYSVPEGNDDVFVTGPKSPDKNGNIFTRYQQNSPNLPHFVPGDYHDIAMKCHATESIGATQYHAQLRIIPLSHNAILWYRDATQLLARDGVLTDP